MKRKQGVNNVGILSVGRGPDPFSEILGRGRGQLLAGQVRGRRIVRQQESHAELARYFDSADAVDVFVNVPNDLADKTESARPQAL